MGKEVLIPLIIALITGLVSSIDTVTTIGTKRIIKQLKIQQKWRDSNSQHSDLESLCLSSLVIFFVLRN